MGKSAPKNQTVTNVTKLPEWVENASQDNYNSAVNIANNLAQPFTGNMVAGINNGYYNAANAMTAEYANAASPYMLDAMGMATQAGGYQPLNVTADQIGYQGVSSNNISADNVNAQTFLNNQQNLQAYMNPMLANVENYALENVDRQRQLALNQTGDQAASTGAFGGSRQAIREAVTNAESARNAGQISAGLRADAYNNAQNLMQGDFNRMLQGDLANQQSNLAASRSNQEAALRAALANQQAGLTSSAANQQANLQALLANQQAGLTSNQQRLAASGVLGSLAGQYQQLGLQGAGAMASLGDFQRNYEQQLLNQEAARYDAQRNYPLEQLNIKMSALGMSPYGKSTSTTGPAQTQGANYGMQALGGALSGAQLGSSLFGASGALSGLGISSGAGTGITALLGALLPFSDETEKTDVKKVGTDPETGVGIYAYRYKGDPKSYPKVVGPMAQEIEQKYPDQVVNVGGKKAVNLGFGPMRRAFK
jgi:hypothetical protein